MIHGDPEDAETLERAAIEDASLLITDAGDRNASVALTALDGNGDLDVVSLTESVRRNDALERTGVDRPVSPPVLIGQRLARKAATSVTISEETSLGADIEIRELLVRRESPLHGVEIRDSQFADRPELTLVAGWFDGELRLPPSPTDRLMPNTVLVVAGPGDVLDDLRDELSGVRSTREHSNVVVAGAGEGGRAVIDTLPDDVSITAIDREDGEAVDVVGDIGEPETLEAAGIEAATALIVTVDDDATSLLAIALARSLTDDLEILARVSDDGNVATAFGAGADYVLSIQQTTARLLAREVHGEEVVSPIGQLRLVRTDAAPFAGTPLETANEESAEEWGIIGVERDGTFRTDGATPIEEGDTVVVAGTDETIRTFEREVA